MTGASEEQSCAFCLKGRGEVKNLIQGPGGDRICDDCVETAKGPNGVSRMTGAPQTSSCAFCLKRRGDVLNLTQGPGGACICDECVEICDQILRDDRKASGKRD